MAAAELGRPRVAKPLGTQLEVAGTCRFVEVADRRRLLGVVQLQQPAEAVDSRLRAVAESCIDSACSMWQQAAVWERLCTTLQSGKLTTESE